MTDMRAAVEGLPAYGLGRLLDRDDVLALIPEGAVLVTEEGLARALRQWGGPGHTYWRVPAFPSERTQETAAAILSRLRDDPRGT